MSASRRRRVRPSPKPAEQPRRRKRHVRQPMDLKGSLINMAIGALLMLMLLLLVSTIRQRFVSKPPTGAYTAEEPAQNTVEPEESRPLQIEVLNGCGVSGLAARYTDYLRMTGFDVIRTENYETFNVLETVVIDRRGNTENCLKIAGVMGIGAARVLQEVNEAYLIDATVLIGKDYRRLSSWQQLESME